MVTNTQQVKPMVNAMTVDVEDYFQVSAFEPYIGKNEWEHLPCRVDDNTSRILDLFATQGVKATFFTLGWVAQRYPDLVKRIVSEGHEIASHGWEHVRVNTQQPEDFYQDIERTRKLLQDLSGQPVYGYRAASYSIGAEQSWAWDKLAEAGYRYSSSIVPIKHDLYGIPDAPRFVFDAVPGQLLEVPISTVTLAGRNINCGGGGWFRLFPYAFSRWAIRHVNNAESQPGIFYFHPWEIDPQQPRPDGIGAKARFRHYLNLERTYDRLERLLGEFNWGRMDDIFLPQEKRE
ncbi:MAG: polysaccharide deacetylase family protein (PEP-CTERM system associated) [Bacteroidia bacterium]|jgi:polysaccharide deacetylase family protein (PEP-CTERM system associated)